MIISRPGKAAGALTIGVPHCVGARRCQRPLRASVASGGGLPAETGAHIPYMYVFIDLLIHFSTYIYFMFIFVYVCICVCTCIYTYHMCIYTRTHKQRYVSLSLRDTNHVHQPGTSFVPPTTLAGAQYLQIVWSRIRNPVNYYIPRMPQNDITYY